MKKRNQKSDIKKIGKIVGNCGISFEDAWVGYNSDLDKLDVICAIYNPNPDMAYCNQLKTKLSVHIAREFGTQFVDKYCNIDVINYIS